AVAIIPDPMPFVVNGTVARRIAVWRQQWRGAGPQVVMNAGSNRLRSGRFADAVAALVTKTSRGGDFAEMAAANPFDGFGHAFARADLNAGLHDAVVFFRGRGELTAFPDIVRHRFLDVNILPRLTRPDAGERVPMIRHRDGYGVNVARG